MRRAVIHRYIVLAVLALLGLTIALAVPWQAGTERVAVAEVTLRSDPPGATVFEGNRQIGVTPLAVSLEAGETRDLRLVRRGRCDAFVTLRSGDLARNDAQDCVGGPNAAVAQYERIIGMPLPATASLTITSEPSCAEVVMDGRREGVTPLTLSGVTPGEHRVQLNHPECFRWQDTIAVEAGANAACHAALEDRLVALYRAAIEKEPTKTLHYTDLIHHLVIKGRFEEADAVLKEAYVVVTRRPDEDELYYFQEMLRIYTRFYKYPETPEAEAVRTLCRELMERADREGVRRYKAVRRWLGEMNDYDARMNAP